MQTSGFIGLLVAVVASRIINERGYATLTPEEKLRLMDGFSKSRMYSLIPLVVLVIIFMLLTKQSIIDQTLLTIGYLVLMAAYIVMNAVFNQRRLQSLQMPATYRRYFTLSQVISTCGLGWLFFTLLFELGRH